MLSYLKTWLLIEISKRLLARMFDDRTTDYGKYQDWREDSLSSSWSHFDNRDITGKDVLDFGCGDGHLAVYLAERLDPFSMIGVDIRPEAIANAKELLDQSAELQDGTVYSAFILSDETRLYIDAQSVDTILAFDCVEHVMAPSNIAQEWARVLRPGGKVLIEWYPFAGAWGPHMESLIPVPWAQYLFGERCMFSAAKVIYDCPEFIPRHWDIDESGRKKPNKWLNWNSFKQQGYVNELTVKEFTEIASVFGLQVIRLERVGLSGPWWRKHLGAFLMTLPVIGNLFVSSVRMELKKL